MPNSAPKNRFSRVLAILLRRCPSCKAGKVYRNGISLNRRCPECDYDNYPEPGFYLGAMMMPYFFSAITTVPFGLFARLRGLDGAELMTIIAAFYFVVLTFLLFYARTIWLHLEHSISRRLNG